jgi:3-dehydroquinate dehydratase I
MFSQYKYCISYGSNDFQEFTEIIRNNTLVELRIDLCNFSVGQIKECLNINSSIIIADRNNILSSEKCEKLYKCIELNPEYIDLDINWNISDFESLIKHAKLHKCKIIISYHNYSETPIKRDLLEKIYSCEKYNPDIIKIVTKSNSEKDNANILSLYSENNLYNEDSENKKLPKLICFCMGYNGKITRITSLFLGAPFTYISLKKGQETAPGQIDIATMNRIIKLIKYDT